MIAVRYRKMNIPAAERVAGVTGDNNVTHKVFRIPMAENDAAAGWIYKLDLLNSNGAKGIAHLDKEVRGDDLLLTWRVVNGDVSVVGPLYAQLRGFTADGGEVWHTLELGEFRVLEAIDAVAAFEGTPLTEFETLEANLTKVYEDIQDTHAQVQATDRDLHEKYTATDQELREQYEQTDAALHQRYDMAYDQVLGAVGEAADTVTDIRRRLSDGEFVGPEGPQGARGEQGPRGLQGIQGEQGPTGATGPRGLSGVYVGPGTMPDGFNVQVDPEAADYDSEMDMPGYLAAAREAYTGAQAARQAAEDAAGDFTAVALPGALQTLAAAETAAVQTVDEAGRAQTASAAAEAERAKQEADRAAAIDAYTKGAADARYANPLTRAAAGRFVPVSGAAAGMALARAVFAGETAQAVSTQGKNLFDAARFVAGTVGRWNMGEGHYVYAAPGAVTLAAGTADGCSASKIEKSLYLRAGTYTLSCVSDQPVNIQLTTDFVSMNLGKEFTAAGACVYSFPLGADGYVGMKMYQRSNDQPDIHLTKLQLEAGSAATAYEPFVPTSPSPDYPAPISGTTPTVLTTTGKSLSGYHTAAWGIGSAASWSDIEDGKRFTYHQDKADAGHGFLMFDNRGLDGCRVTVSYEVRTSRPLTINTGCEGGTSVVYRTPSKISAFTSSTSWQRLSTTCTIKPRTELWGGGYNLLRVAVHCVDTPAKAGDWVEVRRVQVELGETATAYEPYTGQTLALPALEPLYGDGTVADEYDAATGVLTRRWRRLELDGTEGWSSSSAIGAYSRYTLRQPGVRRDSACDCTVLPRGQANGEMSCVFAGEYFVASVPTADYADVAAWQAYLAAQKAAGTPVTVLYELEEPVVTTLEARAIRPAAADGCVYADQGSLDIRYSRDTGGAIDAVAATAAAETAALHARVDGLDGRYAPTLHGTAAGQLAHLDDVAALGTLRRAAVCGVTTQVRTTTGKNLARRGDGVETITGGLRISQFRGGMIVMPTVTLSAGDYVLSFTKLTDKPTTSTSFVLYINGVKDSAKSVANFNQYETGVTKEIPLSVTETSTVWLDAWGNAAGEVIDYQLQLEAGSTATAYEPFVPTSPSPDYPAPISGAAPTKLTRTSKNLLAPGWFKSTKWTAHTDGGITLDTSAETTGVNIDLYDTMSLPVGSYQISLDVLAGTYTGGNLLLMMADNSKTETRIEGQKVRWAVSPAARVKKMLLWNVQPCTCTLRLQIEAGNAITAYEPYTAQTYALPALEPLYGNGTVADEYDMVSGVLTRRWGKVVLDGTERWSGQADGAAYLLSIPDKYQRYEMMGLVCSHYPTRGWVQPYYGLDNNWGSLRFWVTAEYATLADWQAYLAAQAAAGTPVTVLYELAEPATTQHDPQTIVPPAPVCNLYADDGTVDVGYQRDPTIAYEQLRAAIIALGGTIRV